MGQSCGSKEDIVSFSLGHRQLWRNLDFSAKLRRVPPWLDRAGHSLGDCVPGHSLRATCPQTQCLSEPGPYSRSQCPEASCLIQLPKISWQLCSWPKVRWIFLAYSREGFWMNGGTLLWWTVWKRMEKDAGLRSRPLYTGVVLAMWDGDGKEYKPPNPTAWQVPLRPTLHLLSVQKKRTQPRAVFPEQDCFLQCHLHVSTERSPLKPFV